MDEFNEKLADALDRVSCLEGVVDVRHPDDFELGISAGRFDDYQVVYYIAQLIRRGEIKIEIDEDRLRCLLELLHMEE